MRLEIEPPAIARGMLPSADPITAATDLPLPVMRILPSTLPAEVSENLLLRINLARAKSLPLRPGGHLVAELRLCGGECGGRLAGLGLLFLGSLPGRVAAADLRVHITAPPGRFLAVEMPDKV